MPFLLRIAINQNTEEESPRVVFDPDPLQARVGDQIFWTNNDESEAHWPGLLQDDGNIDETFFIPHQIAPDGGVSSTFAPSLPDQVFEYACSLHPDEKGTIRVP
jgi:plastocyanin